MMQGPSAATRYRQAGAVYLVLGGSILALTVFSPELASAERRTDLIHLLVGLPFFVLFAAFIAYGDRWVAALLGRFHAPATRFGAPVREKVVMLLAVSALGRTAVFFANSLGRQPRLQVSPFVLEVVERDPEPRMLINALLMGVIFVFLVRASWVPFCRRWSAGRARG